MNDQRPFRDADPAARIEASALGPLARARAQAAFDHLLGALLDIPAAHLEARAAKIRARAEAELAAALAPPRGKPPSEVGHDLALIFAGHLESNLRRLLNKRTVVDATAALLAASPAPEAGEEAALDPDWLNHFERHAEAASSERMQDLWARVLAAKIRQPAHFSLSTLRFLSELDTHIAELFEKHARLRFWDQALLKPERLSGPTLLEMTFLEEVGLLQEVNGSLNIDFNKDRSGRGSWVEKDLAVLFEGAPGAVRLDVIKITRIGLELLGLMLPTDPAEVAERVAESFARQAPAVRIARITERDGDQVRYSVVRVVKG